MNGRIQWKGNNLRDVLIFTGPKIIVEKGYWGKIKASVKEKGLILILVDKRGTLVKIGQYILRDEEGNLSIANSVGRESGYYLCREAFNSGIFYWTGSSKRFSTCGSTEKWKECDFDEISTTPFDIDKQVPMFLGRVED